MPNKIRVTELTVARILFIEEIEFVKPSYRYGQGGFRFLCILPMKVPVFLNCICI